MKRLKNILHVVLMLFAAVTLSIEISAAATVSGVQTGSAVSNGNGTIVVPIAAVNPASSFLIFDTRHTSNRPPGSMLRGRLASPTTLEFTRVTNETAAITFDAQSGNSASSVSTISWSHTIGTASNRKLIVGVAAEQGDLSGAEVVTGITYNGVALTFARAASVTTTNNFVMRTEIWYLDENQLPSSGSATIQVNFTGTVRDINAGSISIFGAEAGPPEATAANTNTATAAITTPITTLTNGAWLIDVVGSGNGGNYTPGGGQTERWDRTSPLFTSTGASSTKIDAIAGPNSMTQTHNTTSLRTAHVVISVAPAQPRIDIEWSVVEFSAGVNVQRGAVNQTGTVINVPIAAVGGLNQAFVTWSKTPSAGDNIWSADDPIVGELTLPTNLQFRVNGANAGHVIWWQVIEFTNPADINVQKGTLFTMTGATTSVTATLGTSVNVNTTFVLASFRTPGSGADVGRRMLRARLTNSTTITFDRSIGGAGDNMIEIVWQAIDLRDGSTVQRGSENFAQGVAQKLVAISSVDANRSVAFASVQPVGGQNMGRSPYAGDDIIGVGSVTMSLAPTQITMTRNNTKATTDIGWFVVEFNTTPPAPSGYYAMDEGSWTNPGDVIDSSGNGNHGNPIGNVSTASATPAIAGNPGTCGYGVVPFNASNPIVDAVDTTLTPGNTGSVTFWYNSRLAWNVGSRRKLLDASNTGPVRRFFLTKMPSSSLRFRIEDSTGTPIVANTGLNLFAANTWVHVAVTWDLPNNRIEIYVNGVLGGFATTAIGTLGTPNTLYVGDNRVVGAGGTGNTGRSADGFVDEVRVYAIPVSAGQVATDMAAIHPCATVDHYEIDHVGASGGVAVTCEAEPVTIIAHDAGHTPIAPGTSTTITGSTTPSADQWALRVGAGVFTPLGPGFSYTFAAGETEVGLWLTRTTPATIDIDIVDGSGNTEDASEDPSLEFRDTAFRFFADGVPAAIGTQISRKESNLAPSAQAMTLRAVQTSTTTGACEPRLMGVQDVDMAFECRDPSICVPGEVVTISGTTIDPGNNAGPIGSYDTVMLDFGVTGTASFTFNYTDAGEIALHARKDIPANPPDPAITLSGASNTFLVRPFGFLVNVPGNPAAVDDTEGAFIRAGETLGDTFQADITAVGWQAPDDTDNDGIPDGYGDNDPTNNANLVDNDITPNFGNETVPRADIAVGANHFHPAIVDGGTAGALFGAAVLNATNGTVNTGNVLRYSEVGVIELAVSTSNYFTSVSIAGRSTFVGRFYPDHFVASGGALTNRSAIGACPDPFTYMDEDFDTSFTLQARNGDGNVTQNYETRPAYDYAYLDIDSDMGGGELNFGTIDDPGGTPTQLSTRLDQPAVNGAFADGAANIATTFTLIRELLGAVDGPFQDLRIGVAPVDDDGVALRTADLNLDPGEIGSDTHVQLVVGDVRYGRLNIQNAFGSELLDLTVPLLVQYYGGAITGFVNNANDSCTAFTPANVLLYNNVEPKVGRVVGNATIMVNGPITTTLTGISPLASGVAAMTFSAPGTGGDGYVDVEVQTPSWLLSDLDGIDHGPQGPGAHCDPGLGGTDPGFIPGCAADTDLVDDIPTGRGTFGVYSGSGRHIYLRELY